jgi:formylglycine-generating enzyme required for sulfatase activity
MKKTITILLGFGFVFYSYSQNKVTEPAPEGMVFVPQGSFDMEMNINSETRKRKVTVDAFWMSNEITNGEFREFVEWAKRNPDRKLNKVKFSFKVITDPENGMTKDTMVKITTQIDVSTIGSGIADPVFSEKLSMDFKNYYTDKKFDDYPVVGVSFKMAEYFCIWKTDLENEKLRAKGMPEIHSYRIPLETEWEYAAKQPIAKLASFPELRSIQEVNMGDLNGWGLYHFSNNVSEWVIQNFDEVSIVRGGSWKTGSGISERQICEPDLKEPNIGFRIVRSYVSGKK